MAASDWRSPASQSSSGAEVRDGGAERLIFAWGRRSRRRGLPLPGVSCQFDEGPCSLGLRRLRAYRKEPPDQEAGHEMGGLIGAPESSARWRPGKAAWFRGFLE